MSELIDRQAAIDAAKDWYEGLICGSVNGLIKRLNALPTAQPEPKEGKWEQVSGQRYFTSASYFYRCSVCGENNPRNTKYCPNCGAKMEGERQK